MTPATKTPPSPEDEPGVVSRLRDPAGLVEDVDARSRRTTRSSFGVSRTWAVSQSR